MSKLLKIIVNLVVLMAIVIAAALLVPPFVGVDTVMNDNTETDTNLPIGSVAYGNSVNVNKLEKKDKIIYSEGSSTYVYEITDMDASAGIYKVKDIYNKNRDVESITLNKTVPKVVVVVPFIGYAAIALQSKEGLIIIGLGIVFLIILFILSEIWRKDRDDEDEDDEDSEDDDEEEETEEEDDEEELSWRERRRLKKEEKRRRREAAEEEYDEDEGGEDSEDEEEDEEEDLSWRERRRLKKEEKRRRKLEAKGLLEEEDEENEEEISRPEELKDETDPQGYDAAMKDAMSSIAMGVAAVSEPEKVPDATVVMPDADEIEEAVHQDEAQDKVQDDAEEIIPDETEEEAHEELTDDIHIEEIPSEESLPDLNKVPKAPSVSELLAKAQAAGEQPEVKKDEENDITLLDYSDLL